jgi:hypothetical protein
MRGADYYMKKNCSVYKLDLHGLSHENARNATIRFIENHWDMGHDLWIITGKSMVMKVVVKKVLDEYELPYLAGGTLDNSRGYIVTYT